MRKKPLDLKNSVLISLLFGITMVVQAEITVQQPTIVNVTQSQFSVVWETNTPATPRIAIFQDSAGTADITDQLEVIVNPMQSGNPALEQEHSQDQYKASSREVQQSLGQYTIQVRGANPETAYYFKIYSENTTDTGVWPIEPTSFAEVITETENSFLSESSQLLVSVDHTNPFGWLVTATNSSTNYQVAARVGDGANEQQAYLNLSNLFTANGRNWMPQGTQILTIDIWSGFGTHFSQDINIDFTGEFSVSTLRKQLISIAINDHIIMTSPASPYYSVGEPITLQWQDQADNINAGIDLYYDNDDNGADGIHIVGGINEDPDALDDEYQWDTTGVSDGIYYPYAQMEVGSGPITSYSPGAVAIDRTGTDSDADQVPDLWEQLHYGHLNKDGSEDSDNDGTKDSQEFLDNTNPNQPDIKLSLKAGQNIISMPLIPNISQASDLLALLGDRISSIKYIDPATNQVKSTPEDNFTLQSGHGYLVVMAEETEIIIQGTLDTSDSKDFQKGTNLAGFNKIPENYTAYQLLQDIGTASDIASIQRFNMMTGRYETALYDKAGLASGKDFAIKRGEGYIVAMKEAVNGFVIP